MKSIAAVALIVAFVVAEPPPSNSYLPPSNRGSGYPQNSGPAGLPQVVAARSLDGFNHGAQGRGVQGHGAQDHGAANGFTRNSQASHGSHGHQSPNARSARFNDQGYQKDQGHQKGYDSNAGAFGRNAEENADPANYNFGYMVNDHQEGTEFGHHESREEESAHGEYHVVLPDGRKQTVSYEADERGFKPQISYEDTEDLSRSGYDSNANNFRSNEHGYHGNEQNGARSQNGGQPRSGY